MVGILRFICGTAYWKKTHWRFFAHFSSYTPILIAITS